mmetsp:Transcript_11645/g.24983  ORF Transcript_11645/g.24983 Transcript_11645/m.24983 type:complete len:202 (+) Transcript_11645:660-1265(+)
MHLLVHQGAGLLGQGAQGAAGPQGHVLLEGALNAKALADGAAAAGGEHHHVHKGCNGQGGQGHEAGGHTLGALGGQLGTVLVHVVGAVVHVVVVHAVHVVGAVSHATHHLGHVTRRRRGAGHHHHHTACSVDSAEDANCQQNEAHSLLPESHLESTRLVPAPRHTGGMVCQAAGRDIHRRAISKNGQPVVTPPPGSDLGGR